MTLVTAPRPASPIDDLSDQPGCINAVPAEWINNGFRLLALRCYNNEGAPPSFAWIDQQIFRTPERLNRHGLHFGLAFRPEVMDWLIKRLGRPSAGAESSRRRNPFWPQPVWRSAERVWPDDTQTTEWFAEMTFSSQADLDAFRAAWSERLSGRFSG